jgi:hypothetical protein
MDEPASPLSTGVRGFEALATIGTAGANLTEERSPSACQAPGSRDNSSRSWTCSPCSDEPLRPTNCSPADRRP